MTTTDPRTHCPNPDPRRRVLVLGSTGLMGREVLAALLRAGATPRVLVRDPARLATTEGVDVRVGDLRDEASLRAALDGVAAVFHISPHEADEVELTRGVVTLCEELGVRIVFAGVHVVARTALSGSLQRRVERAVVVTGVPDGAVDAALRRNLSGHRLADWSASMRLLRGFPVKATRRELEETTMLLGRAPTDYETYVRDTVAGWAVPGCGSVGAMPVAGV